MNKIRQNAFVVFDKDSCSEKIYNDFYRKTFEGKLLTFLGEIPNAPGHCILTDLSDGKIIGMYHTLNFREANDNEI